MQWRQLALCMCRWWAPLLEDLLLAHQQQAAALWIWMIDQSRAEKLRAWRSISWLFCVYHLAPLSIVRGGRHLGHAWLASSKEATQVGGAMTAEIYTMLSRSHKELHEAEDGRRTMAKFGVVCTSGADNLSN